MILALLALIYLIPLLFVLFVSLMSSRQFALNAASIPDPIMWSNYPDAWVKGSFNTYFVNSLIYTFAIVIGTLIIATLAAFPIARGHLRGSNGFYMLFLSGILLPAGIIPQFFIMQQLGHLRHAARLHPALAQPDRAADLHPHRLHQDHPLGARRRGGDRRLRRTSATSSRSSCR